MNRIRPLRHSTPHGAAAVDGRARRPRAADPAAALRARGLRLTTPRRIILDVVRETSAHPSAASVYARVRRRLPRVSLATVYRNLRRLAAEGLLQERADAAGLRFDGNTAPHDHFTCVACGRIFDVPTLTRRAAVRALSRSTGFEVIDHRSEYYGRCGACAAGGGARARASRGPGSPPPPPSTRPRDEREHTTQEDAWPARLSRARRASRT
jgi:Fe2+ or Zn2+ uptake regulation protein